MFIREILSSIKPITPEKAKIDSLKKAKDAINKNLKAEKEKQKLIKARHTISQIKSSSDKS
jgi:hypothetical protein